MSDSEQDITDGYQCPNVDCDNCQIYSEDELPTDKRCPECSTVLVTFDYDEFDYDEEEDDSNLDRDAYIDSLDNDVD